MKKLHHLRCLDEGILIDERKVLHHREGFVIGIIMRQKLMLTHHKRRDLIYKGVLVGGSTYDELMRNNNGS